MGFCKLLFILYGFLCNAVRIKILCNNCKQEEILPKEILINSDIENKDLIVDSLKSIYNLFKTINPDLITISGLIYI